MEIILENNFDFTDNEKMFESIKNFQIKDSFDSFILLSLCETYLTIKKLKDSLNYEESEKNIKEILNLKNIKYGG